MSAPFQVASLVNPPTYPNSIVWSDDNLIAVATADIVTILNPEQPHAPRGVITLTPGKPFPVGVIDRSDLMSGCLLPTCLSRDRHPCVRSLSWSPVGFAPNHGCLLAVCSIEGRVKIYRQPYCEFQAEWVELLDISDKLHEYLAKTNYGELNFSGSTVLDDTATQICTANIGTADKTKFRLRTYKRKRDKENMGLSPGADRINVENADSLSETNVVHAVAESVVFPSSIVQEGSSVEVFNVHGEQYVWVAGRLQCLDGSRALVHFHDVDGASQQQWFEMDSRVDTSNQTNHPGVITVDSDHSFPRIRPSMDIARIPEQILLAKHSEVARFLKSGLVVEAWTSDRWLEGVFVGFSDGGLLVEFHGDAVAAELNPKDVRLAPVWIAEEKSWQVTLVRVHMQEFPEVRVDRGGMDKDHIPRRTATIGKAIINLPKGLPDNNTKHLITASQYAARLSMLASLVVAWSPVLRSSAIAPYNSCDFFSLLAVGTKSGKFSVWRFCKPEHYSIEQHDVPTSMVLVGSVEAHNAWVTALSWSFLDSDTNPRLLLASGSSDGSVKIWLGCGNDLKTSSEAGQAPFSLFSEVRAVDNVLVSALSLLVPVQSPHKILLAVGKGSGSFEVYTCNAKTKSSKQVGCYDAHVQVVTGLAWAFGGQCLYSCSLENSVHGWIYHKGSLSQVSVPPNNLGSRIFSDLPSVSDSCYGLAISPGNLALAVARRFDAGQLDHMYQKRTQRAAVEFFWIGGQQVRISPTINSEFDIEAGFSKDELVCWGSKLLWSLDRYESPDKHLVIWDTITALLAFKQCAPIFMKHILLKWLKLLFEGYINPSTKDVLSEATRSLPDITSRHLHLLNILCRRVILSSGIKEAKVYAKPSNVVDSCDTKEEQQWMELMLSSEKELRERLVGISLSTLSTGISCPVWRPVGISQMLKWVTQNHDHVQRQLNVLASEVGGHAARQEDEHCTYCSATVSFDSTETAFCQGVKSSNNEHQKHKLSRCAVSMQVCPLTPLWFCVCCQRHAFRLPPEQLFTMSKYPADSMSFINPVINNLLPKPLCPFCGISLQRPQPDFLLSTSPV